MNSISDNIKTVRETIAKAATLSGRCADDITLVAASKTKPAELVREAVRAGIAAIGENRVQEMTEKRGLGAYDGADLHFIGHLQTNKVNKLVGVCDLIETVSSKKLVEMIGTRAVSLEITQNVLIEVNIGKEPQKSGVLPEHLDELLAFTAQTKGINVLGLMAIPPFFENSERNCYYFDMMYNLFVDIRTKKYDNVSVRLLSMGMSDTYEDAIRSGANMVRVGSAIFGAR